VTDRVPIGQLLVQQGHIDTWQLQSALGYQRQWGCRLGRALVQLGMVTERVLMDGIANQLGVPHIDLSTLYVPPEVLKLVPEKLIRARKVLPIALGREPRHGPLIVATSEPQNLALLDEIAFVTGREVKAALASERDIEQYIERHLSGLDTTDWRGGRGIA
jgi:hypothetical protein